MRLATLSHDHWELRSAEESHRSNPDTFLIPTLAERQSLRPGQAAKLIFDIEAEEDGRIFIQGERMWVVVAERLEDAYVGILDNQPESVVPNSRYLGFGVEVPFRAEHVIAVAEPPHGYIDWQLGQPPERRWPR